jgi:homoserine kinase type II
MNAERLYAAWPLMPPWQLSPLVGGTNNAIWHVETADHHHYVLRLITDMSRLPLIRYETALLHALSTQSLPFALPISIKTRDNTDFATYSQEDGSTALAILTPLLPGEMFDRPPERNDIALAQNAALALAQLDHALANLPDIPSTSECQSQPPFGQFITIQSPVSDPLLAIQHLPVPAEQIVQIQSLLTTAAQQAPDLYTHLPQQIIHRDYDQSNLLVINQNVSAVLDFEFAALDIRALDLCVALSWWPLELFDSHREWPLIDAFATAYLAHFPLQTAELQALPALFRLRDAASLIHRINSYLMGQISDERMQARVQHSLWRESWLTANEQTFLEHINSWQTSLQHSV